MRIGLERVDGRRHLVLRRGGDGDAANEILLRETPPASAGETVFNQQIAAFWASLDGAAFSPSLIQFLWVAERCIQLVAQNVSVMPLRFNGAAPTSVEPAWLSNPDPAWYPNGIADAVFSAVDGYYRFGDAFMYVLDDYASGYPAGWTVLPADSVTVEFDEGTGRKKFDYGGTPLDPTRMIQVSRNPRGGLRGTSALKSYADIMAGARSTTVAAADAVGNTPLSVLQSKRAIDATQSQALQDQWVARGKTRPPGAPAIIPPELELAGSKLGFSPEELMLVDVQEFNARVLASSCGVPPFLLNIALAGGLTYQNPAMLGEYWWRTELHSTCARFARAWTAQALPRGSSVYFDPSHLTQPLTAQGDVDESPAVKASPTDQPATVTALRPQMEVTA